MTKTKTIVYITLYSFLICIAMTMGVFALSFPEVSLYTNMYYYTDTSMMDKTKFWNAYMQFNEKAKADGTPIVSEIYFDCYEDSSRKWYFFEEENQHVAISEENAIDVCMAEQYSISAYYYNYYSTKKATQVGAMLILSIEKIALPAVSSSLFSAEYVYGSVAEDETTVSALTKIQFKNIDTTKVIGMGRMFYGCKLLTHLDLTLFDTKNVINMSEMFFKCNSLQELDLSHFNTSKVTQFYYMFRECYNLEKLDISKFDTSNTKGVLGFSCMFYDCRKLKSLDLSSFDTSSVESMSFMFLRCQSLTTIDVSHFDTSKVTNMGYMFYYCDKLETVDLSSFDTSKVTKMHRMFQGSTKLRNIYVGNGWTVENLTNTEYKDDSTGGMVVGDTAMFAGCTALFDAAESKNGVRITVSDKTYAYAGYNTSLGKYGYLLFKS